MEKEDFKPFMQDYTMIESITESDNKFVLVKKRFGIEYIESHYKEDLKKWEANPVYIK